MLKKFPISTSLSYNATRALELVKKCKQEGKMRRSEMYDLNIFLEKIIKKCAYVQQLEFEKTKKQNEKSSSSSWLNRNRRQTSNKENTETTINETTKTKKKLR